MAFVDEIMAVAEKQPTLTTNQRKEVLGVYRTGYWHNSRRNEVLHPYGILDRLTGYICDSNLITEYNPAKFARENRFTMDVLQREMPRAIDRMTANKTSHDIARLLGYAKVAENAFKDSRVDLNAEEGRFIFEVYLACQKALGDIWGYDRVSAGTYKSQRGHVRKVVKSFARKQPQDAQWALETLHRYERNPEQLKLDFA